MMEADTDNQLDNMSPYSFLEWRLEASQSCAETIEIAFEPLHDINGRLTHDRVIDDCEEELGSWRTTPVEEQGKWSSLLDKHSSTWDTSMAQ